MSDFIGTFDPPFLAEILQTPQQTEDLFQVEAAVRSLVDEGQEILAKGSLQYDLEDFANL